MAAAAAIGRGVYAAHTRKAANSQPAPIHPREAGEPNRRASEPTKAPVDTHELVAMVAPRGLLIMDNPHIANLGPRSAHVAALGGAEVYKALGVGDAITYHSNVADGGHCNVRPEWKTPLQQAIQRFLKKSGTAAGTITARSNATGNLADWREWTTPTLN